MRTGHDTWSQPVRITHFGRKLNIFHGCEEAQLVTKLCWMLLSYNDHGAKWNYESTCALCAPSNHQKSILSIPDILQKDLALYRTCFRGIRVIEWRIEEVADRLVGKSRGDHHGCIMKSQHTLQDECPQLLICSQSSLRGALPKYSSPRYQLHDTHHQHKTKNFFLGLKWCLLKKQ